MRLARVALASAAALFGAQVMAQDGGNPSADVRLVQSELRSFDIPPQPLAGALIAFGQQSGLQVTVNAAILGGVRSLGVTGQLTPAAALQRLLAGTSITWRMADSRTVALERLAAVPGVTPLSPIAVEAATQRETALGPVPSFVATRSASGTKTDTPLIETPQSISVVGRPQMEAQNAQTVPQALRYTAGIVAEQRGVNMDGLEYLFARGFQIEEYLNGLRLPNSAFNNLSLEPYFLERIEYLHGPASVLYGQTSPGGLVNLVSKRPTAEPFREVLLQTSNFARAQAAFDLSGPIDAKGQFLYRITANAYRTDTQVEHIEQSRVAIAPAFTWRPSDDTRLTVLTSYQNDPDVGHYAFLPARGTVMPNQVKIPRDFDVSDPSFTLFRRQQYSVGYEFEHRVNDIFTVSQNFRYLNVDSLIQSVFASGTTGVTPDGQSVVRFGAVNDGKARIFSIDNQVQAKFDTGPVHHHATAGVDYQNTYTRFGAKFGANTNISITNPVYGVAIPRGTTFTAASSKDRADQVGLYGQDQIRFGPWAALLGIRQDWATDESETLQTGARFNQDDEALTGRAGLVYLFDNGLAPYVSYSLSFQPQLGRDFFGTPFVPTTGEQYEVGVKYQPPGFNSFVTVAGFDLTRQNVTTTDPARVGFSVQTGEVRARGVEVEGHASLGNGVDLILAYTYTDADVTKSNTNNLDQTPPGIPQHTGAVWAGYRFAEGQFDGLSIGAGVRYVGSSFGDNPNSFKVPSYTLVDAGLRYDLEHLAPMFKGWQAGVSGTNLLDTTYVSQCLGVTSCSFGLARLVLVNLKYNW